MPRNSISQVAYDAEPMLGELKQAHAQRTWLPAFATEPSTLDIARWQTRAAHGLSWHRGGKVLARRLAH